LLGKPREKDCAMIRPSLPLTAALLAAPVLAGCATVPAEPLPAPGGTCNAGLAQVYVGQAASAELGANVQRASKAARLRWLPPRTAVTMDYSDARVNVRYDDAMKVTGISCG
jgi:hypothetical protein